MFSSLQVIFVALLVVFVVIVSVVTYFSATSFFNVLIGQAHIHSFSPTEIIKEAAFSASLQQGLIIFFMFTVLGGILFVVLHRSIFKPIRMLAQALEKVGNEDFSVKLLKGPKNELGTAFKSFNNMVLHMDKLMKRTERAGKMKSEFILIAAHQLRTPLTEFKWGLSELMRGSSIGSPEEKKEFLEAIYNTNEGMISLVNNILNAEEVAGGGIEYSLKHEDVGSIVKQAIDAIALTAKRKDVKIILHEDEQSSPHVNVDSFQIELVVKNLLSNAINYSSKSSNIDVFIKRKGDVIEVAVKDQGIGIPKEEMNHIFTRFFRGGRSMEVQPVGSGLGLFIAKNIIKKHNGKIWAESEQEKGSTFYFSLPIVKATLPEKEKQFEEFASKF